VDGRDYLEELDVYGRIILKCMLKNDGVNMCPRLIMFKNGSMDFFNAVAKNLVP
jgi:hypothetical protein